MAKRPGSAVVATKDQPRRKVGRPATGPTKTRISFYIDTEVVERARNAAYWASPRVVLNELAENGLDRAVSELERKNGGPFPARKEKRAS
jgi:hypothetical protein